MKGSTLFVGCLFVIVAVGLVGRVNTQCPSTEDFTISKNNSVVFRINEDGDVFTCDETPMCSYLNWVSEGDSVYRPVEGSVLAEGPLNSTLPYDGLDPSRASGPGRRFLWYGSKASLRAGVAAGNDWNDRNIGFASVALGAGNRASGRFSTAFGRSNTASGLLSTVFGVGNRAGIGATCFGAGNRATGLASTSFGGFNTASGPASTSFGGFNTASGLTSTTLGIANDAIGLAAISTGVFTTSNSPASVSTGRCNTIPDSAGDDTPSEEDSLFTIGNGEVSTDLLDFSCDSRSTALTVLANGDLYVAGDIYYNVGSNIYPLGNDLPDSCGCVTAASTGGCSRCPPDVAPAKRTDPVEETATSTNTQTEQAENIQFTKRELRTLKRLLSSRKLIQKVQDLIESEVDEIVVD